MLSRSENRFSQVVAFALAAGIALATAGCGGGATSDPVAVEPTGHTLKPVVESIAQSGTVGSAGAELEQAVEEHPEFKADVQALIKADGNQADVKKKANELLKKL